jgi:hypothetical protein
MTEIVEAELGKIVANPYRRLHDYPYIEDKLAALQRSIEDVGLWPGVIARRCDSKYELAFGHHRIEAARRMKLKTATLIIRELSNREMLQYMGRENLEDYNAVFLIQLEAWEAALESGLFRESSRKTQAIDIARLLGWIRPDASGSDGMRINDTASACHAAYTVIQAGKMKREDFVGLTVTAAKDIARPILMHMKQAERFAKKHDQPPEKLARLKKHISEAAVTTARQVREGNVPVRQIKQQVDFNVVGARQKRPSPLFSSYANAVANNLKRTLLTDADGKRMKHIIDVLPQISLLEDWQALRRMQTELGNLSERALQWQKRLT